jgi:choline dehydrogenase-like flavoprotein
MTEDSQSYDVVILGAGYAGLIVALRLGRPKLGFRVPLGFHGS